MFERGNGMRMIVAVVALVSMVCSSASAQEECVVISDSDARLQCFDKAFGVNANETGPVEGHGKWNLRTDQSPLTDEKSVFLRIESDDNVQGRFGAPGPATLLVRCQENTTSAYFILNDLHLADIQTYGKIEYRVDEKPMQSRSFVASTDNKALGLWNGGRSIPFLKELLGSQRLIIRATPYNESPVTAKFDTRGFDTAVVELRETCSW